MTDTIRSLGTASEDAGVPHGATASAIPQAVRVREPWFRRGVPAWLQAAPMAIVFAVFLVIPLLLVVMVSFWDYNDFEILPGFTFDPTSRRSRAVTSNSPISVLSSRPMFRRLSSAASCGPSRS